MKKSLICVLLIIATIICSSCSFTDSDYQKNAHDFASSDVVSNEQSDDDWIMGKWDVIGEIDEFNFDSPEYYNTPDIGLTVEFMSDNKVRFSDDEREGDDVFNYKVTQDEKLIIYDDTFIVLGNIDKRSNELFLQEYNLEKPDDSTTVTMDDGRIINRKQYITDDGRKFIENDDGLILRKVRD